MTHPVVDAPSLTVDQIIALNADDEITYTDAGDGRRYVALFNGVVRYVIEADTWLVWNGKCWEPDTGGLKVLALAASVTRQLKHEAADMSGEEPEGGGLSPRDRQLKHAFATESLDARKRMVKMGSLIPDVQVEEEELDANADVIVTDDCTVNLRTGMCEPTKSADLNTRIISVGYDTQATSPLLQQYLETFIPEQEDQDVIFAVLGSMLRGGNVGRLLPMMIGKTTSGKSQLVEALEKLLGRYACSIGSSVFRGNLDDKPRPDLVKAMYTRVAVAVEASKVWELHADQIKRLTGGDRIPYRNLYQGITEAVPRFTPLIVSNEMPRIKGADSALKRRIIVMRFDHTVPVGTEDTRIKSRFVSDPRTLQALLTRLVRGAQSPMVRDGLRWDLIPKKFAIATVDAFGEMSHVDEFLLWMREENHLLDDKLDLPASQWAKASDLHVLYKKWVKEHGDKNDKQEELSLKDFNASLRERGWESKPSAGTRWVGKVMAPSVVTWNMVL